MIYCIESSLDAKVYIGQTVNLQKRWSQHTRNARVSTTGRLYCAMREKGTESFSIHVKEAWPFTECNAYTRRTLNRREKVWITTLKSLYPDGYNVTDGGCCKRTWKQFARRARLIDRRSCIQQECEDTRGEM